MIVTLENELLKCNKECSPDLFSINQPFASSVLMVCSCEIRKEAVKGKQMEVQYQNWPPVADNHVASMFSSFIKDKQEVALLL